MGRKKNTEIDQGAIGEVDNSKANVPLDQVSGADDKAAEQKANLLNVLEKISKKYEIVLRSAEFLYVQRIRTGVFAIDWATGGGIPKGKVTVFWGDWASSKTTVALRVAANVIKNKGYVFWIDAESSFNTYWASVIGVDVKSDRIYIAQPSSAEAALNLVIEVAKSGGIDLIVLDSVAALAPLAEKEKLVGEWQQALMARLLGQFSRKYLSDVLAVLDNPPTLLLINQARERLVMFGNPITKPGGKALNYISALEIRFKEGKPVAEKDNILYVEFSGVVNKNKFAKPGVEFVYKMAVSDFEHYKAGDIIDEDEVLGWMRETGFIVRSGKTYSFIHDSNLSFNTLDEIKEFFKNREVYDSLRSLFLDYLLKNNYAL